MIFFNLLFKTLSFFLQQLTFKVIKAFYLIINVIIYHYFKRTIHFTSDIVIPVFLVAFLRYIQSLYWLNTAHNYTKHSSGNGQYSIRFDESDIITNPKIIDRNPVWYTRVLFLCPVICLMHPERLTAFWLVDCDYKYCSLAHRRSWNHYTSGARGC